MNSSNVPNEVEPQSTTNANKNEIQETASSNVLTDQYKLAWFDTSDIDPDIIIAKCEHFGKVKHCRQFQKIPFPLFNRRE